MSGAKPPAPPPDADPWRDLRSLTPARVALGRSGVSLPTGEVLRFGHAHALARDAVHRELDGDRMTEALGRLGLPLISVASAVPDRATYLRRPDLGRRLAADSRAAVAAVPGGVDLVIVIADGLSATAVEANAPALVEALLPGIRAAGWPLGPLVLAHQARVALGDEVGAALGARLLLMLIGERPGLSSPDSLGAYLTLAPRVGRRDHERNCVSNIRAAGLPVTQAAAALMWLMGEALRRGETGVALKDERLHQPVLGPSARDIGPP